MTTHTLTVDEADQVNALNGFSREPGLTPAQIEENPGATEGDSYPCFNLPNGERWVFTGKGGFILVVSEDEEADTEPDETPVTA